MYLHLIQFSVTTKVIEISSNIPPSGGAKGRYSAKAWAERKQGFEVSLGQGVHVWQFPPTHAVFEEPFQAESNALKR
jgi:hypothetical protein